ARRTGKDVNSHTVLDGIITTIMATIQRINIIGSREGSRNRRRLKANQTGKKFRVGIKSNISTNRNNLISGVDRDRKSGSAGMPRPISYAVFCLKKKIVDGRIVAAAQDERLTRSKHVHIFPRKAID